MSAATTDGGLPLVHLKAATVEEGAVDGQAVLVVRSDHRLEGARPLALVIHGAGSGHRAPLSVKAGAFTQSLIDAGWVVAASEAHGDAWGSPTSQRDYLELLTKVRGQFPISGVVLVSLSMGGVAGLQMVANGSVPDLLAWVGVTPVTNLAAMAVDPRFTASVQAGVHKIPLSELDPLAIPARRLARVPLIATESPGADPWTPPAEQMAPFVAHMRPVNPVHVIDCADGHVGADCYPTDVVLRLAPRSGDG